MGLAFRDLVTAASVAAMSLTASNSAFADSLINKTITYTSGGVTGGTFSVFIGPSGSVYESQLSGDPNTQGVRYKIGKTIEETNTFTDVLGSKLTCSVSGAATLSDNILRLKSVYHCSNGNFDHEAIIQIDGDTCSVQRNERNQGLAFGNANVSSSCAIVSGNKLAPAKWLQ
jgi:hypothetical protein